MRTLFDTSSIGAAGMGGFYGSVQVRSEDRDAVLAAAEQVAAQLNLRMLVGPVINAWIGIYPERAIGRSAQSLPRFFPDTFLKCSFTMMMCSHTGFISMES